MQAARPDHRIETRVAGPAIKIKTLFPGARRADMIATLPSGTAVSTVAPNWCFWVITVFCRPGRHQAPRAAGWEPRARPRPYATRGSLWQLDLLPLLGHEPHDAVSEFRLVLESAPSGHGPARLPYCMTRVNGPWPGGSGGSWPSGWSAQLSWRASGLGADRSRQRRQLRHATLCRYAGSQL